MLITTLNATYTFCLEQLYMPENFLIILNKLTIYLCEMAIFTVNSAKFILQISL